MKRKKTALIFGVSGQDGAYLSKFLLDKGYHIIGTTRNNSKKNLFRLIRLNIIKKIKIFKGEATNINFCNKIINNKINEIYYLAGDSSVVCSFEHPENSLQSNATGFLNVLNLVKNKHKKIKIFNAASGQFYGNNRKNLYSLKSNIDPQSPYGVAKAVGFWFTKIFREKYNIYCCSGVLFNHESPLRSDAFVTKKIINHCHLIKKRKVKYLYMGDINISRDWGWAPEYVEAMYLMLRQKNPKDLVIGSGKSHSLKSFIFEAFRLLKIPKNRLKANTKKFMRSNDIKSYRSDPRLAKKILNWKAKTSFKQIIRKMICDELF